MARRIAHEVGHHLIAERGYVLQPHEKYSKLSDEEPFADQYETEIWRKMRKKWTYYLAHRVSKFIWPIFRKGREGLKKNYASAASLWYKAWLLDKENQLGADWMWRAKAMIEKQDTLSRGTD